MQRITTGYIGKNNKTEKRKRNRRHSFTRQIHLEMHIIVAADLLPKYEKGYCLVHDCIDRTGEQLMKKGIETSNRKPARKRRKTDSMNPEQEVLCRFVEARWQSTERINGKNIRTGTAIGKGLQVNNKICLLDGHYKLADSGSVRITAVYNEVPEWASDELMKQYNRHQNI